MSQTVLLEQSHRSIHLINLRRGLLVLEESKKKNDGFYFENPSVFLETATGDV